MTEATPDVTRAVNIDDFRQLLRDECAFAAMFGRLRARHDDDMDAICASLGVIPMDLSIGAIEMIFERLAERARA